MRSFSANEPKTVFGSMPATAAVVGLSGPFFPFFAEAEALALGLIIFTRIFFAGP